MPQSKITRRGLLGVAAAGTALTTFAGPWKHNRVWAQASDKPIKIGLTSDASGQYANSGASDRRGMMTILVAHAKIERFEDPENAAYDRYTPRLHKHAASLLSEWVDAVLFASKKFRVTKENAGFSGERGIAAPIGAEGGERILRTVGSPACIAKNRFGLPREIALSWTAFIDAYGKAGAADAT